MSGRLKKVVPLLLAVLVVFACLPVHAVSVTADGVKGMEFPGLKVSWQKQNGYYILTASWLNQGDRWELCLTGLPEKLSSAQIRLLLAAASQGKRATLSGAGLIDAEKFTNKLPLEYGEKLVQDPVSREPKWGDSQHCWAASVSNMLTLTGWLGKAAEPDTGRKFTGTDDLFGYFNRAFENEGSHFSAALDWVFKGQESEELARPHEDVRGPLIKDAARKNAYLDLREDECDSVDQYMALMNQRLPLLKKGWAIGTAVSICSIEYPLKSDPGKTVSYLSEQDAFVSYQLTEVSRSKVRDCLFVPDARNGLPLPVVYDPVEDCYREERSGAVVDKNELWVGKLVYDSEQDLWFSIDETFYEEEESDPFYFRIVYHSKDEVELDRPVEYPTFGGQHAVTVMGYVMDLSDSDPATRIKAIVLANSDNDAMIYRPDQTTPRREDRPDTYDLYPAEVISCEGGRTISLKDYLPGSQILLYSVTALTPAPGVRPVPPVTGDAFPVYWCAALLILSLCALKMLAPGKERNGK